MAVATCIETPTRFARRTIAAGAAIPIGTILKLNDANTVVVSAANNDPFGGIAWMESTATDTFTEIVVAMNGRWSMTTTAAAITAGGLVSVGGADAVRALIEADVVLGCQVGKALNTIGGGGGTVIVDVGSAV